MATDLLDASRGFQEISLDCGGLRLAAQMRGSGPLVICLHGWLDNSASFLPLLAELNTSGLCCVAVDFAGHGRSEHRPKGIHQYFVDLVWTVHEIIKNLAKNFPSRPVMLMGHSMGAGAASLYAGTFPDAVSHLVLLDGLGPLSDAPEDAPENLARALLANDKARPQKLRYFRSIEAASELRSRMGGISQNAARLLSERGLIKEEQGYRWSHDPRLKTPSLIRLTEAQVEAFLSRITAKTLLVLTEDDRWKRFHSQLKKRKSCIRNLSIEKAAGGHHVHLEAPEKVAPFVQAVLDDYAARAG